MASYEKDLFDLIERIKNQMRAAPLYLGGIAAVGGGSGGPPGGFIGSLPQKRVACDITEDDTTFVDVSTIPSGISLLTNLNNIRYRIRSIEDDYIPDPSGAVSGQVLGFNGTYWVGVDQIAGSGEGASSFIELTDTPISYTGSAGKSVVVNATEDGLEFVTASGVGGTDVTATDSSTIDFTVTNNDITGFVIPSGIKLDDLGTPDDNTDLDATTGHHGLLPKLSGTSTTYLNGLGNWVTVSGGEGGGHTIQDEGTSLTQRTKLNFVGEGVTVTDDGANDASIVTIAVASGGGSGASIYNKYVTVSGAADLSNEIVIPGLAGDASRSGIINSNATASVSDEFDSSDISAYTGAANDPDVSFNANTTIPSHLFMAVSGGSAERRVTKAWTPAGNPLTIIAKVSCGGSTASAYAMGISLYAGNSDGSARIVSSLIKPASSVVYNFYCYTFAGSTYTQRGSTIPIYRNSTYLKLKRNSDASWDSYVSFDGLTWEPTITNYAYALTVERIGFMLTASTASQEYAVDFIRVLDGE